MQPSEAQGNMSPHAPEELEADPPTVAQWPACLPLSWGTGSTSWVCYSQTVTFP